MICFFCFIYCPNLTSNPPCPASMTIVNFVLGTLALIVTKTDAMQKIAKNNKTK